MTRHFTVSGLTAEIKELVEAGFRGISLEGEISNSRPASSGHWYFTLKDSDAVIAAVMFRNRLAGLDFQPQDGMLVRATGSLSVYEKRGNYQIVCETMQRAGQGALLLTLEERKRRLAAEGLFDSARKRPLPLLPKRVALVTSPTGAAVRDILQVLGRRSAGVDVVVVPALVQGDGAAAQLAAALRLADRHRLGDVIIVGRGGGSAEDLLPFSDEELVRAVAACETPVISAVGHETDSCLCDLAADLRAPTPSAAAELVVQNRAELLRRVMQSGHAVAGAMAARRRQLRTALKPFGREYLETSFRVLLQPRMQRLDDAKEGMVDGLRRAVAAKRARVDGLRAELAALSPLAVLERGYALVRREGGAAIASAAQAAPGLVSIRWRDGRASARIERVDLAEPKEEEGHGQSQD